jgi:aspartate/glutamate racemase
MTTPTMRIALIHAVSVAMEPVTQAFARSWPEAELVNMLDDSLSRDRARDATLTPAICARIDVLADYAYGAGAVGILFTCSAFGPAIEAVARRLPIPVLKPNEAMFSESFKQGQKLGMLATFGPSVATMEDEFNEQAQHERSRPRVKTVLVEGAMDALRAGDTERHNALIAQRANELADCDAIMLAHFSTSRAADAVAAVVRCPVLTSPGTAVALLKRRLLGTTEG